MRADDISRVVDEVVARVVRRLEGTSASELAAPLAGQPLADWRVRLQQAVAEGACRLFPQALSLDQCSDFAAMTESTLLRFDARESDIRELCREAIERGFCSVCVGVEWIEAAASSLKGSNVRACASIGFPTGGISSEFKAAEIRRAVGLGADEVDVVVNIARLRAADYRGVVEDLQTACRAAQGRVVKAVIEAAELTCEQKVAAALLAKSAGAQFVKSSTGFGPDGVTIGDVALIRNVLAGSAIPTEPPKPEWAVRVGAVVAVATQASH